MGRGNDADCEGGNVGGVEPAVAIERVVFGAGRFKAGADCVVAG